jgi:hypothetical protein
MRKKLLLILATVTVATTAVRATSAAPEWSDQVGALTNQFTLGSTLDWFGDTSSDSAFLPPKSGFNLAFLPPKSGFSLAFLPPKSGFNLAFLPPKSGFNVAFLPPKSGFNLAFLPPKSGFNVAFLPPKSGFNVAFLPPKSGFSLAFLPPSNGVGLVWSPRTGSFAVRGSDVLVSGATRLAMLPLGAETGRHIRTNGEKNSQPDAVSSQEPKPVARLTELLGTSYAMLPLGTETGRHVRDLDRESNGSEKSVAVGAPKAAA